MRMYGAILLLLLALYAWPEQNIGEVPFAQLTLGMIAKTVFFVFVCYWVLRAAFSSLMEDEFWPWRWTKQIVISLAIRAAMLIALVSAAYFILVHSKLGPKILEYPTIVMIASFIAVTWIVCMSDDDIFGLQPAESLNAEAKPWHTGSIEHDK